MIALTLNLSQLDIKVLELINQHHFQILDWIMISASDITEFGLLWIVFSLFILVADRNDGKKRFILLITALLLAYIVNDLVIKHLIFRERPYLAVQGIRQLGLIHADSSFPSGHAAASTAFTFVFFRLYSEIKWIVLILAVLVCYSRVYNGMHYPSDVASGIALGLIIGSLVISNGSRVRGDL